MRHLLKTPAYSSDIISMAKILMLTCHRVPPGIMPRSIQLCCKGQSPQWVVDILEAKVPNKVDVNELQ